MAKLYFKYGAMGSSKTAVSYTHLDVYKRQSTEIPLVVASERGGGQTKGSNIFGVVDGHHDQR